VRLPNTTVPMGRHVPFFGQLMAQLLGSAPAKAMNLRVEFRVVRLAN
jgi:hypothetical protein